MAHKKGTKIHRWSADDDILLNAAIEKRAKMRSSLQEMDFWTLVGSELPFPVSGPAAKGRHRRLEEVRNAVLAPPPEEEPETEPETLTPAMATMILRRVTALEDSVRELHRKMDTLIGALGG